jgi:hypothetical protein
VTAGAELRRAVPEHRSEHGSVVDEERETTTTYEHQLRAFVRVVNGEQAPLTGGTDAIATMQAIDDVYIASGPEHQALTSPVSARQGLSTKSMCSSSSDTPSACSRATSPVGT